jgi:hemerythrin-like domain-containing protein
MDVIESLIAGHREVAERKDVMQKLARNINDDAFFWDDAFKVVRFFNVEVKKHFQIEEKVLFPAMKRICPPEHCGIIEEIEAEHAPILEQVDKLEKIAEKHSASPGKQTREELAGTAGKIMEMTILHAHKEDTILFPLIKKWFKSENYEELEENYYKYIGV